ncbi:DUF4450 domain-containing protein [Oleiharenicola lentus]|uniref:DUF4450 domain-containing protein n=1 Tax=Oleiharenicola lentus TaxID=2508720 RepID=UPI003F66E3B0
MRFVTPVLLGVLGLFSIISAPAQPFSASQRQPNLRGQLERPLRYTPDNGDFVIRNGGEFFNRPLYGGNTAFRVDAGDKPEFALYLPGRGGNLRLGIRTTDGRARWLNDAAEIIARYRPGSMLYEIRDPLLGDDGRLTLTLIAPATTEGIIVRVESRDICAGLELIWAYGGANGKRGKRDGDIGTENVPISEYFQLKPEHCAGQTFAITGSNFSLKTPNATLAGIMPAGSQLHIGDAQAWSYGAAILASNTSATAPVLVGRAAFPANTTLHLAIQRVSPSLATELADYLAVTDRTKESVEKAPASATALPIYRVDDLPRTFTAAETHFAKLRSQIRVETPDAFLNAAVGALNVAADAIWDEPQGAVMHGAIAWRSRLLGWRGPYAMDALGWHDRARRHLSYWATRQNTAAIPERIPPPDENSNLARSEVALHSNGDLSNSHYDMNLVYIDAVFRHLLWTGDLTFARELWPVIQRHLAWEKRLFRREFTTNGETLPLYEAYAAIWASDDLQYHGGGVTHASAYNFYHHTTAARVAKLLGEDATPYEREAALIARGMRAHLWLEGPGTFAEFKDSLGRQLVHPSAALWTIYHTIDSHAATPREAGRMVDYVKQNLPALPIHGPGVPNDAEYHVYATTNWMPYEWSINNVVMGENLHTALAFWQAGRPQEAWELTKGSLLAAMFMGICPGNVGSMSYLDVYRRESQRDFADGSGVTSRAIVEGLFGVRPDLLDGTLRLAPGFPEAWDHASIAHGDFEFDYRRSGARETFKVVSKFTRPLKLHMQLPAHGRSAQVNINGVQVSAQIEEDGSLIVQPASVADRYVIEVIWQGAKRSLVVTSAPTPNSESPAQPAWLEPISPQATFTPVDLQSAFNDRVTQIFRNEYRAPRSKFVSLALPKQGLGGWAGSFAATAEIDDGGLRRAGEVKLTNGVVFKTPASPDAPNALFTSHWENYPIEKTVSLHGSASAVYLLMAGSTNWMQSRIDNGEVIVTYTDGTTDRLALRNPETWWPIEQDYFIDDYQFRHDAPRPWRVSLKTGEVYSSKGVGAKIPGGAATVLALSLDPKKQLHSLTVRALANEVVIGLLAATLVSAP